MIANPSYKASGCGCGGGGGSQSAAPCGCGGADCASCQGQGIVRPRFFAGQLLTEDDLQLLTEYVGQKDRLHNRHLFGAGVVCGLEVTCHPCGGGRVIVHPGYALDCCGNDLTLACAQPLDINGMIRDLRRDQLGGYDCGDPCPEPGTDAARRSAAVGNTDQIEQGTVKPPPEPLRYCLYIRYCEQASDPVMPYSTGDDCGDLSCQPTRVREGVKFELRCRPRGDAANALLQRLCACLGDLNRLPTVYNSLRMLQRTRATMTNTLTGNAIAPIIQFGTETSRSFSEVHDWLLERLNNSPFLTDCTLSDKIKAMTLPTFRQQMSETEKRSFVTAIEPLIEVFINYVRDCVCRALNPACVPCNDSAVLLACLEVDECKVVKVCSLERTFVLSPSAVRYWLPPLQLLGNLLERLCCDPLDVLLTESSDKSVNVGIGELDMSQLLKQEITRILEDSLCMVGGEKLRGEIDKIFPTKSSRDSQPPVVDDGRAAEEAVTDANLKAEAAPAPANKVTPKVTRTRKKPAAETKPKTKPAAKVEPPAATETKPQADAAVKVEPPADKPAKRVAGRIKTKPAKGAKK